jgi:hypothetical protein
MVSTRSFRFLALLLSLFVAACQPGDSSEKVIKSVKEGDLDISLAAGSGALQTGENDLLLTFADGTGKTVDVGAASLAFHMPAMGTMAEMNNQATLTTTDTPGKYRARVSLEMGGTWEARIAYDGPAGKGKATMSVQSK